MYAWENSLIIVYLLQCNNGGRDQLVQENYLPALAIVYIAVYNTSTGKIQSLCCGRTIK